MDAQTHWQEGHKYALEGMKVMLAINGGAAVALLAALGQIKELRVPVIAISMMFFGFGALAAAMTFFTAYLTQLHYGNREIEGLDQISADRAARKFHFFSYALFSSAAIFFVCGLACVAFAILFLVKPT